jgi:hypothetical protein
VQPDFEKPRKPKHSGPQAVMSAAEKQKYPVMPGQNRALKRRR